MAKKNNHKTKNSASGLTEIQKEIAALQTQAAELQQTAERAEREAREKMDEKLRGLTEHLGLSDFAAVAACVAKFNKFGTAYPTRTRQRLSDETREQIGTDLRAKEPLALIAEKYKVSQPTVFNIKKELGLVKARAAKV